MTSKLQKIADYAESLCSVDAVCGAVVEDELSRILDRRCELRQIQLVAREGMLSYLLGNYEFPTENHRKIIELIYEETLEEMEFVGLEKVDGPDT